MVSVDVKHHVYLLRAPELWRCAGLSVLMNLTVSVDVKQHWYWSQFVPNMSLIFCNKVLQHLPDKYSQTSSLSLFLSVLAIFQLLLLKNCVCSENLRQCFFFLSSHLPPPSPPPPPHLVLSLNSCVFDRSMDCRIYSSNRLQVLRDLLR